MVIPPCCAISYVHMLKLLKLDNDDIGGGGGDDDNIGDQKDEVDEDSPWRPLVQEVHLVPLSLPGVNLLKESKTDLNKNMKCIISFLKSNISKFCLTSII